MKLWLIRQDEKTGYATYDAAVVVAPTAEEAQQTHPSGDNGDWNRSEKWASNPMNVRVIYLGEADLGSNPGVVLGSYTNED